MKFLRYCSLFLLLAMLAGSANAYRINVLDPPGSPTPPAGYTIHPIQSLTFTPVFAACQTGQDRFNPNPLSGELCFSAQSLLQGDILALNLDLGKASNYPAAQQVEFCGSTDIFSSASCSIDPSSGDLLFSFTGANPPGHPGKIVYLEDFTITITANCYKISPTCTKVDPKPSASLINSHVAATLPVVTPEPSSIILMSTGLVSMMGAGLHRRYARPTS